MSYTSVGLVLSLFDNIWVSILRILHFGLLVGYGYLTEFLFSIPLRCIYHARTFKCRQNHHSMNMIQNGMDPNNNSGIQKIPSL